MLLKTQNYRHKKSEELPFYQPLSSSKILGKCSVFFRRIFPNKKREKCKKEKEREHEDNPEF